ncbi:hypothetical protein DFH27DRAFT_582923 [Peziza echinospora]|nr:hypothetical protein DFH27DRAFT_582923 [Peziza echinospora]
MHLLLPLLLLLLNLPPNLLPLKHLRIHLQPIQYRVRSRDRHARHIGPCIFECSHEFSEILGLAKKERNMGSVLRIMFI